MAGTAVTEHPQPRAHSTHNAHLPLLISFSFLQSRVQLMQGGYPSTVGASTLINPSKKMLRGMATDQPNLDISSETPFPSDLRLCPADN